MFSVIIPLYNKSDFILRAIHSVMNQSFSEWEVIVVDDGSTDDSYEKILPLFSERIIGMQQKNKGVSEARNLGISIAKFSYIAFLDADDYWHKDFLLQMSKGIEEFPNDGIWGAKFVSEENCLKNLGLEFKKVDNFFSIALEKNILLTSAVVLRRNFFIHNEGFKKYLTRGEDLDVWFRAILYYGNPVVSENPLVFYEKDDENSLTKSKFPISKSIISFIGRDEYFIGIGNSQNLLDQFNVFKFKFIYFNIYKYLDSKDNFEEIKIILRKLKQKPFLINFFYNLPYPFLKWYFQSSRRKRIYLKIINFF